MASRENKKASRRASCGCISAGDCAVESQGLRSKDGDEIFGDLASGGGKFLAPAVIRRDNALRWEIVARLA